MDADAKPRGRQASVIAQRTRRRIVRSAGMLFAARGFEAVSLRDIAGHAGVTHGLLRHHFGSKEDIWRAVIDSLLEEYVAAMTPLIEEALAGNRSALDTVKTVSRTVIVLSGRYPEVPRLLTHEGVQGGARLDYFMAQIAPLRALMAPLIEAVQHEGELLRFSEGTFLLSVLMLGAMPFAMAALAGDLAGVEILEAEQIERHADRAIATLFCEPS